MYKSQEELFNLLSGAFNVKLRLINKEYNYIKKIDIWSFKNKSTLVISISIMSLTISDSVRLLALHHLFIFK